MRWLPPHFIARNSIVSFGLQGYAKITLFIINMLLAHQLSLEDYGLYATIISWVTIGAGVGLLGLPWIMTRSLAVQGNSISLSRYHRQFIRQMLLMLLALVVCLSVVYHNGDSWLFLLAIPPLALINGWLEYYQALFTGLKQIGRALLPKQLLAPTAQLIFLAALLGWQANTPALEWVLAAVALAWLIACLPTIRLKHSAHEAGQPVALHNWSMSILIVLGALQNFAGVIILGIMVGMEEAALFAAIQRIRDIMVFCLRAVTVPFNPRIAEHLQEGNIAAIWDKYRKATIVSSGFAVPLLLLAFLFPTDLLTHLFSAKYAIGSAALTIIAGATFVGLLIGPCGHVLLMMEEERFSARLKIASFAVGVVLMVLLIPTYGALGAAIGFSADLLIASIGSLLYMRQALDRKQVA